MLTIGMLGGMSWESTAEYYRLINTLVRERLGGFHSARIILDSVDFADVEKLQGAGDWEAAGLLLAERATKLEGAGADFLLLCTNTMHKVANDIEEAVKIPLLHIAEATASAVRSHDIQSVGLLGTRFTMEQEFYRGSLARHGLNVLVPSSGDRDIVHNVIYDELVRGIVSPHSRQLYRDVIHRLVADGAEGIILGCTEIELLVSQEDSPVAVFPTTKIHVEAAVARALESA